ncbi:MAG: signal peptidase I [Actinobacteria bacterium 13_1_20CM_4_69_9]|jgi:signal peptidase|nr:MAG: signal peptidase I [Actinobacteria bacterium 13_1_20CM_4_69_9]
MRHSLRTIARVATALVAGAVVAFVVGYAALLAAGFRPVVVYSGSMRPTLGVGSLAVDRVAPARSVRVRDVITFNDPYVTGRLVTHRVARIVPTEHGLAYRTKGDANTTRDPWAIRLDDKVGRVAFDVPLAGYVLWYAHTREIRALLLAVFAAFVLVAALRRIWRNEPARPAEA